MSVIDEVEAAVKETLRNRVADFGLQIKTLNNTIDRRKIEVSNARVVLDELKFAQDRDEKTLRNMERKLKDFQNSLEKIESGDIVIRDRDRR